MAYESFPNDAHNARAVSLAEHEQIAAPLGLSGLLNYTDTSPVYADSTGLRVKLRAGVAASVRATRFNNATETLVTIQPNTSGNTRIDLVVLRLRRQETSVGAGDRYTVVPYVIQGAPAATPSAPAPVRNDTPGTGFWDLPLAEVTVINNAATITGTQVASRAYFISGSGYAGRDDWAKPPVEAGVIFRANDSGITYIGTATGTWTRLSYNTGWVSFTNGQSKAGWEFRTLAVARDGNLVVLDLYLLRTGGAIGASTHQYFGPVPSQFTPNRTVFGVAQIGTPDHSTHVAAQSDGVIALFGNFSQGISTGSQVFCNMSWLAD